MSTGIVLTSRYGRDEQGRDELIEVNIPKEVTFFTLAETEIALGQMKREKTPGPVRGIFIYRIQKREAGKQLSMGASGQEQEYLAPESISDMEKA
ncbi:hypothetical protein NDU88_001511 [Pleurodeles waltl]|uniref:Uncharacterized protein n=1 Tax=Pleurodeles waltl TaxID=8319 RepID=A0AAV7ML45_PLEWA|nr:hypothetical protein NDU88_001511 [Pleurodeles waltl]